MIFLKALSLLAVAVLSGVVGVCVGVQVGERRGRADLFQDLQTWERHIRDMRTPDVLVELPGIQSAIRHLSRVVR